MLLRHRFPPAENQNCSTRKSTQDGLFLPPPPALTEKIISSPWFPIFRETGEGGGSEILINRLHAANSTYFIFALLIPCFLRCQKGKKLWIFGRKIHENMFFPGVSEVNYERRRITFSKNPNCYSPLDPRPPRRFVFSRLRGQRRKE